MARWLVFLIMMSLFLFTNTSYAGIDLVEKQLLVGVVLSEDTNPVAKNNQLSVEAVQGTCFKCHEKETGKFVHQPYARQECRRCHEEQQPGSGHHGRLKQQVNLLCQECHPQEGNNHPLDEAGLTCLNCHQVHTSDNPERVLYTNDQLCLGCHNFN
ncbi:MAG: hypothetical protein H0Z35_11980 [Thermoanaerobacteraceae bacterium]|nr:hypothetical protein [Thermoanaerobacteraceae bacterium]